MSASTALQLELKHELIEGDEAKRRGVEAAGVRALQLELKHELIEVAELDAEERKVLA